jgi:Ca2+-binding EF-hand superfamily protein
MSKKTLGEILEPKFRTIFNLYDLDNSKTIDKEEMKDFAKSISLVTFGVELDPEDLENMVQDMFGDIDENSDQGILKVKIK